uniref:Methyltransferase 22, Kin17 lysine n=1 Tax=Sphenodon punctatus TaxID=8508 RepID=A0A8D0GQ59_SPHPU
MVDVAEKETMDDITFRSDAVLSDVHLHAPNKRHFMVRLNAVGQPVFLSQFKLLSDKNIGESGIKNERDCTKEDIGDQDKGKEELDDKGISDVAILNNKEREANFCLGMEALLDDDGDLEVVRRPRHETDTGGEDFSREKVFPIILTKGGEEVFEAEDQECMCRDIIKIEHTMATPLEDAGKQIWRGAFLLADYILYKRDTFKHCTALELGGGTGITSIIMATIAKTVYCTDVGEDLLAMCERNVTLNKYLTKSEDPEAYYSWSEEEIANLHDHTTVILAADVFYDDDLTDAFFKTLYRITHNLKKSCTIYLSIEKRLNFTLRHMDITCEAYNHFRDTLNDLAKIRDQKMKYTVEPIKLSFHQFIIYERMEQLELWKIAAEPLT